MTGNSLILVPGAQHGAWCWRKTLEPLRALGHDVHPITLTGLADRAHLLTPDVDLNTHITDVIALIEAEELTKVTLVGHSYGGMVIAGAAARLRHPAVRRLVYLDSPVPIDGDSVISVLPGGHLFPHHRVMRDGVAVLPVHDAGPMGVHGDDLAWVQRRLTPHPYAAVATPLHLPDGWNDRIEQVYIRCVAGPMPYLSRVDESAGWRSYELRSGHDAMVDAPKELVDLLNQVCTSADDRG